MHTYMNQHRELRGKKWVPALLEEILNTKVQKTIEIQRRMTVLDEKWQLVDPERETGNWQYVSVCVCVIRLCVLPTP